MLRVRSKLAAALRGCKLARGYGAPLIAVEGEPFFDQDRFDVLKWRLLKRVLQRRAAALEVGSA